MILALILAATTATAAPADPSAQTAPTAAAAAAAPGGKPAADKMICKTEIPIGTRFPKKVCRSAAAVEEHGRTDRQDVEAAQKGYSGCGQLGTRC